MEGGEGILDFTFAPTIANTNPGRGWPGFEISNFTTIKKIPSDLSFFVFVSIFVGRVLNWS